MSDTSFAMPVQLPNPLDSSGLEIAVRGIYKRVPGFAV